MKPGGPGCGTAGPPGQPHLPVSDRTSAWPEATQACQLWSTVYNMECLKMALTFMAHTVYSECTATRQTMHPVLPAGPKRTWMQAQLLYDNAYTQVPMQLQTGHCQTLLLALTPVCADE